MSHPARRPRDPAPSRAAPRDDGEFLLGLLRRPPQPSRPIDSSHGLFPYPYHEDPAVAAVGPSHSLSPANLPPWLFPPVLPRPPRGPSPSQIHPRFPPAGAPPARFPHDGWNRPRAHLEQMDAFARPAPPGTLRFGSFNAEERPLRPCRIPSNGEVSEGRRIVEGRAVARSAYGSANRGRTAPQEDRRMGVSGGRRDADLRKGKREHHGEESNRGWSGDGYLRRESGSMPSHAEGAVSIEANLEVETRKFVDTLLADNEEEEVEVDERIIGEDVGGSQSSSEVKNVSHSKVIREEDALIEQVEESLVLEEHPDSSSQSKTSRRWRKMDYRRDNSRGNHVLNQRERWRRASISCRRDINSLTPKLLSIYLSLIPTEVEKAKQKQLLSLLQRIVSKEWPDAQLHLYGSCANSFGVSNSDIDVCLAINSEACKSEILLKLADLLQSDNFENVQALTHARVPIVKLMDPVTGISCDICVNNLLAVVNTKLLRDYALIDERLRQLAFIVKHWAKSRRVNETYQGTLSSYAYVLMCIHFLQLRSPAILPCLQKMKVTYRATVEDVECSFFDEVEKLHGFGSNNNESIAELVWTFFNYWAYRHDYANDVISIRVAGFLGKQEKDWTRRIGNERHLICIEDPFETSHDLGRVVDRFSIKILREEFERAAEILQFSPNPEVTLFEPYVKESPQWPVV